MSPAILETPPRAEKRVGVTPYLLKLLAGILVFVAVMAAPLAVSYQLRVVLATFAWAIVWWIAQPVPWGATALLPIVVFPASGIMDIGATIQLYGQPVFFWVMGTVLIGRAIEKHGVARRLALAFLALPGVGGRTQRVLFAYMLAVTFVSAFISDNATIAMMIPIGMLLVRHVRVMMGAAEGQYPNFAAFITLATLYASIAGGTVTILGVPHNATVVAALARLTGRQLGFFEWMVVGVPVAAGLLLCFYATLRIMVRPEFDEIPGGAAFVRAERARLGPATADERRVLLVFAVMVLLFVLPGVFAIAPGNAHPLTQWTNRALSVWVVPPIVMLLLFTVRSASDPGNTLLTWSDAERYTPWGAVLLVTTSVAMNDALAQFHFVEFARSIAAGFSIPAALLPYLVAGSVVVTTVFLSGVATAALYCSIFLPVAAQIGYNPASIAVLAANVAVGLLAPFAGPAAATAFVGGEVSLQRMVRVGVVASIVMVLVTATIHLAIGRFL